MSQSGCILCGEMDIAIMCFSHVPGYVYNLCRTHKHENESVIDVAIEQRNINLRLEHRFPVPCLDPKSDSTVLPTKPVVHGEPIAGKQKTL